MTAKEFFDIEDCENNDLYDIGDIDNWHYTKEEMILFATNYYRAKLKLNKVPF